MSNRQALTQKRLMEIFEYIRDIGCFVRKRTTSPNALAGQIAGYRDKDGRITIWVDGRLYLAHRLAWLYVTGSFPDGPLDHKDLNPSNNRWDNLRPANHSLNGANRPCQANNKFRIKGITFEAGKYRARICKEGVTYHLGRFGSLEEAGNAYVDKAKVLFGEYAYDQA